MRAKPVLGDWEIPRITSIQTLEHRAYAELPVPGRSGSLFQDLNQVPTRVAIQGSLFGLESQNQFLDDLRSQFQAGEPVTFVADILTATDVQYVLIETLELVENNQHPDQRDYLILLKESPPPPPPNPLGGLDTGLLDQAAGFLDTVTGALDAIDGLGNIPNLSDPTPQLTPALDGVNAATAGLEADLAPLQAIFGSADPAPNDN
ncbi:MAG: hypothetical protein ACFB2W_13755 [Leptolyngbyaceae cyanobacterium]